MKGAGTNHRALGLSRMPDIGTVDHLIEVNFTFGAVISLFCHLRIFNVLPHVMGLDDPIRNGVHGLLVGFGKMSIHLGEQETQPLEGLLFGAGEPLDSVAIANEGALADPVAFWLFVPCLDARHGLNES